MSHTGVMAVFHWLQTQDMGVLRNTPRRFPTFQMYSSSLLLHGSNRNPASVIKINQYNNTLLCQLVHWYEEPKVFMWQSQLLREWNHFLCMWRKYPRFGTKNSASPEPNTAGIGNKYFASWLLCDYLHKYIATAYPFSTRNRVNNTLTSNQIRKTTPDN